MVQSLVPDEVLLTVPRHQTCDPGTQVLLGTGRGADLVGVKRDDEVEEI